MRLSKVGLLLMMLFILIAVPFDCGTSFAQQAAPPAQMAAPSVQMAAPITSAALAYSGLPITYQMDLNGQDVLLLIGGMVESLAAAAHQQIATFNQQAAPNVANQKTKETLAQVKPTIEPIKQALTSISHVAFVQMQPNEDIKFDELIGAYQGMMSKNGWSVTMLARDVRAAGGGLVMMAPESKGLLGVFQPGKSQPVIVALVTTTAPLGDLLAQVAQAGGPQVIQLAIQELVDKYTPKPPAPAKKPAAKPTPKKAVKKARPHRR